MPDAPLIFKPYWLPSRSAVPRFEQERRGSARKRGYDGRWEKARKTFLAKHSLCVCCMANGVVHPATVVDHIEPHKSDKAKFWDSRNWQALCGWCHNAVKQPLESKWLKGLVPAALLPLDRIVDGFVHPADR